MKVIIFLMKKKEMENIFGKMVDIIQVNLNMIYFMETEQNIIQMEK